MQTNKIIQLAADSGDDAIIDGSNIVSSGG